MDTSTGALYKILKWVEGGGYGQVVQVTQRGQVSPPNNTGHSLILYHIVTCKWIQRDDIDAALEEYNSMARLGGGPHIAALHPGMGFHVKTKTMPFFMDYYKGKDLNRQVQVLCGAG